MVQTTDRDKKEFVSCREGLGRDGRAADPPFLRGLSPRIHPGEGG